MGPRRIGVEEEFLLVDPDDGRARAMACAVLRSDDATAPEELDEELQLQQIETGTRPCTSIAELSDELARARRHASKAARAQGTEIAALGTSPVPVQAEITPSRRYRRLANRFGLIAQEQLTCGCHLHVDVDSDEEAVGVLDRIRPWLAPLIALSANSPFWQGVDSRYASYRSRVWSRWPSAGPTEEFGSAAAYHDTVRAMTDTGTVLDDAMIYFDARLSARYPTIEVRVADVCLHAEDAVLLAVLVRALVATEARRWSRGTPPLPARVEMLRLASWQAARFGLDGELLDPRTLRPTDAHTVVGCLVEHVSDALENLGERAAVDQMLRTVRERGSGAQLQRAAYARKGRLSDVVADAVRRTGAR